MKVRRALFVGYALAVIVLGFWVPWKETTAKPLRQTKANSDRIADHPERTTVTLSVPRHSELKPGRLRKLIRDAGLTVEELIELL
jgi:hypothetical protein